MTNNHLTEAMSHARGFIRNGCAVELEPQVGILHALIAIAELMPRYACLDGLAADCEPAPQAINPADVREGDLVRAEWGKVVIEGEVLQVRGVLGDVWVSIGGVPEKNLTFCSRILLLDRPDPDAPLVGTIARVIAAGAGARAVLDALRAEWTIEPKAVQS